MCQNVQKTSGKEYTKASLKKVYGIKVIQKISIGRSTGTPLLRQRRVNDLRRLFVEGVE